MENVFQVNRHVVGLAYSLLRSYLMLILVKELPVIIKSKLVIQTGIYRASVPFIK